MGVESTLRARLGRSGYQTTVLRQGLAEELSMDPVSTASANQPGRSPFALACRASSEPSLDLDEKVMARI